MQVEALDESTSLCPECFAQIPCRYEAKGGKVYQAKTCPTHGNFRAKYWDSVEHYQWTRSFAGPDCTDDACCIEGSDDRARCLAVVDVTDNCNLACDYCFAGSKPGLPVASVEEVRGKLETVVRESGGPTPIQFSGGEPTTRDDLPQLVSMAKDMGFSHIEVNSNGIKLAEPGYAATLKAAGVSTIYLQFDGFGKKVYKAIRNTDLTKTKAAAIEQCRAAGVPVILVPTIVPGTNDDQLGDIIRFGLDNLDVVRGINVQPVSHFGRHADDTGHLSLPAIAELIAEQTGFLKQKDLLQVPCCSPNCSSATMLLAMGEGKAMPLTRFVSEEAYRDVVDAFERTKFMDLLAGRDDGVEAAKDAAACCGIPVPDGLQKFLPRMLALTITGFMDADTVDVERLGKCCINVPTKEGQLVPFCGYNLTNRAGEYALREQYRRNAEVAAGGLPMA